MSEVHSDFMGINEKLDAAHHPISREFQEKLTSLEGRSFGSLEANQQVASLIQQTAARLQMAFLCPKCDQPARFKCSQTGNSKEGVFSFAHTKGTHGATVTIPKLVLLERNGTPVDPTLIGRA